MQNRSDLRNASEKGTKMTQEKTKRRIINHWTAGTLSPNNDDLEHYHFIIDGKGIIHIGTHSVASNDNTADNDYAAHTGGGNTMRIGIAVCGMYKFISAQNPGKFLLTKIQLEKLFETNANIAFREGHKIFNDDNLMTHREFGLKHPETSSAGKIDICFLPPYPDIKPDEAGNFIRNKSQWYLDKLL